MPDLANLPLPFALAATALLVLFAFMGWRLGRPKRNAARARRLGARGERRAQALLEAAGFRIIDTQVVRAFDFEVDGKRERTHLRADFLVTRGGHCYVADAKAGAVAPSAKKAATRRQMLEYAIGYDAHAVLLVDTEHGRIHELRFRQLEVPRAHVPYLPWALAALLAGLVLYLAQSR